MEAFYDADCADCGEMTNSKTRLLMKVKKASVMWETKKQTLVVLSSGEVECIAMSYCRRTLRWLRRILWELSNENISGG